MNNKMVQTISIKLGDKIKQEIIANTSVDFITSNFTIYAFNELNQQLEKNTSMRFLFNEPTFILPNPKNENSVDFITKSNNKHRSISELFTERGKKNNLNQSLIALRCYNYINKNAKIKSVRNYNIIHANNLLLRNNQKDSLFSGTGISLSLDGLGYISRLRKDFNTIITNDNVISEFIQFFEEVWNNDELVVDVKQEFLDYLKTLFNDNSPELVYYLTLYHLFKDKLTNDIFKDNTGFLNTKIWKMLYNFQQDGVAGAIKKLELYNGCIIADSVGLGKTFEALAIIKYYELRNERVLVLVPKKLRGNWIGFTQNTHSNILLEDRFNYDVLNHTDLSRDEGFSGDIDLSKINWGNYNLVVIDESHNFRNNPALKDKKTRYQKLMDDLIKSGIKTKVLMLSATPVNNRLRDLKNQIMFITEDRDDAFKENLKITSIEQTLRIAQLRFNEWSKFPKAKQTTNNLLPMLDYSFFNLLNAVTIARSRKHIEKYYDIQDIGQFPLRLKPISIKTDIDINGEFPPLEEINSIIAKLKLPIYSLLNYVLPTKTEEYEILYAQIVKGGASFFRQSDREKNLVNLMRVNILKRLESSVHSFKLTVERILNKTNELYNSFDQNVSISNIYDEEIDDDEIEDFEIGIKTKVKLKDLDHFKLKADLKDDIKKLNELYNNANLILVNNDAKISRLKDQITQKINNPINHKNKKVIVFTAFADTAIYLYEQLSDWALHTHKIHTGIITGSQAIKTNLDDCKNFFDDILVNFSPKSNKMSFDKEIDLLIATDCISEGQNLQDCDYLINYDIHWNPVRIIQRFGRIDRIGSKNKQIQLVNFWPNLELDEYINLENRVRNRMTMVDLSATGDDDLLSPESKELKYRHDQLKQLQEEVIDLEDFSGGISITDLTLDDYLMSLDKYIKQHPGLLESYPTGIYAISNIDKKITDEAAPGVIFCLKQKNYAEVESDNTLFPYHLVYVQDDGTILNKSTNPKRILDLYKALTSGKDDPIIELINLFNMETKNGKDMSKYTALLEQAIFQIQGHIEEKGIKSLFRLGKATIIDNKITGLNDFELITYLVIK